MKARSRYLRGSDVRSVGEAPGLKQGAAPYPLVDELKAVNIQLLLGLARAAIKERREQDSGSREAETCHDEMFRATS
jgi:hypothetical protein